MPSVEAILNIPAAGSPLAIVDRINEGLPVQAVEAFARRAALEPATKYRIIGKATLARRRARREPLSRDEGSRLAEAGIEPSVGSVGDSFDNALAERVNGLFKTEVIDAAARGAALRPWSSPPSNG